MVGFHSTAHQCPSNVWTQNQAPLFLALVSIGLRWPQFLGDHATPISPIYHFLSSCISPVFYFFCCFFRFKCGNVQLFLLGFVLLNSVNSFCLSRIFWIFLTLPNMLVASCIPSYLGCLSSIHFSHFKSVQQIRGT